MVSDLHANIEAVEKVWDRIDDAEMIICLGDLVGIGPRPSEVVRFLSRDRRVSTVMGNHDHNTVYGTELGPLKEIPRKPHHEWVRQKLSEDQLKGLISPMHREMDIRGKKMVFMHRHPTDCGSKVPYFEDPRPKVIGSFYDDVPGDILFFGHTHMPLDITDGRGRRYINPGAIGAQNGGEALYVMVSASCYGIDVDKGHVPYDTASVKEDIMDVEVPYGRFINDHFFSKKDFYSWTDNPIRN